MADSNLNDLESDKSKEAAGKAKSGAKKTGKFLKFLKDKGIIKMLFASPAGPIILAIILFIIFILLVIGAYSFFTTMPGMMLDKLTSTANGIWKYFLSGVIGNAAYVTEEQQVELAKYIEDMGYDLYGFGFGKPVKDESGEIKKVEKGVLFSYVLADMDTYTVEGTDIQAFIKAGFSPLRYFFNNSISSHTGMISFGDRNLYEQVFDKITVDKPAKKMTISVKNTWWKTTRTAYTFNMDGWSGRYGKPLEFMLTLHLATMAPEIPNAIATESEFDTKVHIDYDKADGYVRAQYFIDEAAYQSMQAASADMQIWNVSGLSGLQNKSIYETGDLQSIYDAIEAQEKKEEEEEEEESSSSGPGTSSDPSDTSTGPGVNIPGAISSAGDVEDGEDEPTADDNIISIVSSIGLSKTSIKQALKMNGASAKGTKINAVQPYISYVDKAWFKDIFFIMKKKDLSEEEKENYPNAGENDEIFNAYQVNNTETELPAYEFHPDGTSSSGAIFSDMGPVEGKGAFKIIETRTSVRKQTQQPMKGKVNTRTKELFVGKENADVEGEYKKPKYFIYDGTIETAKKIDEVNEKMNAGLFFRKDVSKELKELNAQGIYKEVDMNKNSLTAFTILENMKTKDADFILRDFKELLVELKYFKKSDFDEKQTQVLDWIIPKYTPKGGWPIRKLEKLSYDYGTLIKSEKTVEEEGKEEDNTEEEVPEEETTTDANDKFKVGFKEGEEVITPGVGKILQKGDDFIEIEFSKPDIVKGMKMYITGFSVDLSEATYDDEENLEAKTKIGITGTTDIKIILMDAKNSIIENVEEYMSPVRKLGGLGYSENPEGTDPERWRDIVISALEELSLDSSPSTVDRVIGQIKNESSGDPNSVNDYDSNASFDCSAGVLQAIAGTYNTYKRPEDPPATAFTGDDYRSGNYDPMDPRFNGYYCIYACINYCANKYGRDLPVWPGGGY